MRKELLVFVPTAESGEEISVTALTKNRNYVLINTIGGKVTANRAELIEALLAIEEFDKINNRILVEMKAEVLSFVKDEIEYGDA